MDNPTNQMSDQRALIELLLSTIGDDRAGSFLQEAADEAVKEITFEIIKAEGLLSTLKAKRTAALALAGRFSGGTLTVPVEALAAPEEERPESDVTEAEAKANMAAMRATRKLCNECVAWLPHTEFHKQAAASDGLRPTCKGCRKEQNQEARARALNAPVSDPADRANGNGMPEYEGELTTREQAILLQGAPNGAVLPKLRVCAQGHDWMGKTLRGLRYLGWSTTPTQYGLRTPRCRQCHYLWQVNDAAKKEVEANKVGI